MMSTHRERIQNIEKYMVYSKKTSMWGVQYAPLLMVACCIFTQLLSY